ncbi:AraC family transcriptional regulator [Ascidiimonas aurantiaca]|uniref:helix-turn-helix transcriptional regulator n=1 Tax=Ascidiimonas aurantiaca TaxID=1685432 RepID=UPI0030EB87B6
MRILEINQEKGSEALNELGERLNAKVTRKWGEHILEFNNEYGNGIIKSITFNWGVTLFDYDVCLNEDTTLVLTESSGFTVEFVFITEGNLKLFIGGTEALLELKCYQNIIISPKLKESHAFIFPEKVNVKVNVIHIVTNDYLKKKNHNLNYLNEILYSIFREIPIHLPYSHLGNYNLSIANEVNQLKANREEGIIRTLSIEGRLNLILAMQLMEHHNLEKKKTRPDSFSHEEINRLYKLTQYIIENIEEPLHVCKLAKEIGMNPKKLQLGFNLLFAKSVNGYIRQLKLQLARDYLKNSDLTISEIVYKIGFRSRSYFSKIFFEEYGILPREYRSKLSRFI